MRYQNTQYHGHLTAGTQLLFVFTSFSTHKLRKLTSAWSRAPAYSLSGFSLISTLPSGFLLISHVLFPESALSSYHHWGLRLQPSFCPVSSPSVARALLTCPCQASVARFSACALLRSPPAHCNRLIALDLPPVHLMGHAQCPSNCEGKSRQH